MIQNPCYDLLTKTDCPRRCVGCRSSCTEWAFYMKAKEEEYAERLKICQAKNSEIGYILRGRQKLEKRQHKR